MTDRYYNHPSYNSELDAVYLYCDGSQLGNGKCNHGRCGYGVFIPRTAACTEEHLLSREVDPAVDKCTNNVAELLAMTYALLYIRDNGTPGVRHDIVYDSTYAAGVITGTMKSRTNQRYVDAGKMALAAVKDRGLTVRFLHTYGHRGGSANATLHSVGNDIADLLANGKL